MKISNTGVNLIKKFENFKQQPYLCLAGRSTIGYGHVITKNEKFNILSIKEANKLLMQDLIICEKAVARNINVKLKQNQFDALVSFVFNVGGAALQRSTLRQKINYGAEDNEIYNEFLRWIYVGLKKSEGLLRRRKAEAEIFLS